MAEVAKAPLAHSAIPEADSWRQKVGELEAARQAAERAKKDAEYELHAEVARWKRSAQALEVERDVAERKMLDSDAENMRNIHEVQWAAVQQAAAYEDRIRALEALVDQERRAHTEALEQHEQLMRETRAECEERVRDVQQRCEREVSAALARAREAEEIAEQARRRANEEVALVRAQQEDRVKEIRQRADARVFECETQARAELERMQAKVLMRQKATEETLFANGRQRSQALQEAQRHVTALEQDMKELHAAKDAEMVMKEMRFEEWKATQRKESESVAQHHKGLLDLEKDLHAKTMERTMDRITRHLQVGQGETSARHVASKEGASAAAADGSSASSPLARAGGAAIIG